MSDKTMQAPAKDQPEDAETEPQIQQPQQAQAAAPVAPARRATPGRRPLFRE